MPQQGDISSKREANWKPDRAAPPIEVRELTLAYGSFVVLRDVSFTVGAGEVFAIMGGSGCGKSTLFRNMLGLIEPSSGEVLYFGKCFTKAELAERERVLRRFGVLYQTGALWSSMTLLENVALPLQEFTRFSAAEVDRIARLKLALVGLRGFEDFYPSAISGGMRKRAALARALSLDPEILFLDEPSAGLDPVTSRKLDELILRLRDSLGCSVVVVSHEIDSLRTIADRAAFLDASERKVGAIGTMQELESDPPSEAIARFFESSRKLPAQT